MKEFKKLIEQGINQTSALIVSWHLLSQEDKESFDFKTLSLVWESFPDTKEKEELWFLLKKMAKNFDHYFFILENTFGDKVSFFEILKEKAKTFNQKFQVWKDFNKYLDDEDGLQKKEIWDWLEKKAVTLKLLVKLWAATDKDSEEEKRIFSMIKKKVNNFADCQFLLNDYFITGTNEWNEIYSVAEEKAKSFEDYVCLWEKELHKEKEAVLFGVMTMKAETLEQSIYLLELANHINAPDCLVMARMKL